MDAEPYNSPEATAVGLHEEDGRNGTDEERSSAYERHVVGVVVVEADFRPEKWESVRSNRDITEDSSFDLHQNRHVVENSVDASKLSKKDHDVGVDDGATSAS
jgi:hypothetical protein